MGPSYINFRPEVFEIFCGQTDRQTDGAKNTTCSQHSWLAGNNEKDAETEKNDVRV